jgi:tight adherence protein B
MVRAGKAHGPMPETVYLLGAACLLAAFSAAALICALFFPALASSAALSRGRTLAAILERAGRSAAPQGTRSARRAQAIALKLVAEERRMKKMTRISQKLAYAGLEMSTRRYAIFAGFFGFALFLAGILFRFSPGTSLSAALLLAVLLPSRLLDFLAMRRQRRFLGGFTGAIDIILRGARSGLSLPDCMALVANDAAPNVRQEFAPVVAQLRAGVPLTGAMDRLAMRMPLPEVKFFTLVIAIQSQTGGNFTEALANLAGVLRERERVTAKVRTASAEVKASAITIGSLPFIVVGATALFAPDYIAVLWREEAGRRLAGLSILWLLVGVAVLRRMARIEA